MKFSLENSDIFVLVDESHRTQSGELHKAMKKTLPKSCYIGFTGTPLLKSEKNSFAKFGGEIHRYTIQEAINDKAVLPLLYEGRLIEQEINDKKGLDERFELICRNLSYNEKEDLKQKWVKFQKIASSEKRLFLVAADLQKHFTQNLKGSEFKAILATNSKFEALRYHAILNEICDLKSAVIISSNEQEGFENNEKKKFIVDEWAKIIANSQYAKDETGHIEGVKDEFINGDGVDLLIVVDKLLTGFDAPRAKVLYIDKSLKDHSLLQAIARVNRLYVGKDSGVIIDYRGLLGNLDEALNSYNPLKDFDEDDLNQAVIDIKAEILKAKTHYENLEKIFEKADKNDKQSFIEILKDKKTLDKFKDELCAFARAFGLAMSSDDEILSEKEIAEFKTKIKFYNELRKAVQIQLHLSCDFNKFEWQMQKLLDNFIDSKSINKLGEVLDIFDEKFEQEVAKILGENAKAESILSAARDFINEKINSNPAFFKSLSAQIDEILKNYKNKRINEQEKLKQALQIKESLKTQRIFDEKFYPKNIRENPSKIAFYDNVYALFKEPLKMLKESEFKDIAQRLTLKADELYERFSKKPQWWDSPAVRDKIYVDLQDEIWQIEDELKKQNISVNFSQNFRDNLYDTLLQIRVGGKI